MKNYQLVKNKKQNYNLICDDYVYNKENRVKKGSQWRCKNRKCQAFGIISETNDMFVITSTHNHQSNYIKAKTEIALSNIKEETRRGERSNMSIITDETKMLNAEVLSYLPKLKNINDRCTIIRKKKFGHRSLINEDIPLLFQKDLCGDQFMQYDEGVLAGKERFIIFYSKKNDYLIKNVEVVLVDGTFWSAPLDFKQLLTLNILVFGRIFPICYILLNGKTEEIYKSAFKKFVEVCKVDFKYLISDYEIGLINALKNVFPNAKNSGCSFHFTQAIWRKIQSLGLSYDYKHNIKMKKKFKQIFNLVFVPVDFLKIEYYKLKNSFAFNDDKVESFFNYFEHTYIGTETVEPKYGLNFWNCSERVKFNIPRTINSLEAWHRSLNSKFNVSHPNICKLIDVLKMENERVRIEIAQSKNCSIFSKKILYKEERLRRIINSYRFYEEFEFFNVLEDFFDYNFE